MDKNAIKKYAIWARRELIEKITQKAQQYGIGDENELDINIENINGLILSSVEKMQRNILIKKIKEEGIKKVIEEVAYTWFNRFIALRFMEVNGYLPSHIRVFTDESNNFKPQILMEALHLELSGIDKEKVFAMKSSNQDEELYKYLLIMQCNELNEILPGMFQKISDYTELLLPDYLLREGSVIEQLVTSIPESDWKEQVQIIGWLYQYYITEKHDEVINPIGGGIIAREDIPAATQLFTTDWIVKYLIDNSLGKYWIKHNSNSKLAAQLSYYIHDNNESVKEVISPQEVTVFDPCVGSGHFLLYAFDVLIHIYNECGYSDRDATEQILLNNIYGTDIDARAEQLAYFSLMMKARQYNRRIFSKNIQPHIYSFKDENFIDDEIFNRFHNNDNTLIAQTEELRRFLASAKDCGSIYNLNKIDIELCKSRIEEIKEHDDLINRLVITRFTEILDLIGILKNKYAVVVTNPPYLNKYNNVLKKYINDNYKDYSGDLFSVFMVKNFDYCITDGYVGFMTPNVWMFIKQYEKLREYLVDKKNIVSLIQMAKGAFFKEATVDVCAFVLSNLQDEEGDYIRLEEFRGDMEVQEKYASYAINNSTNCDYFFRVRQADFNIIPGKPIVYWLNRSIRDTFKKQSMETVLDARIGLVPGDNNYYLRYWFEVDNKSIGFNHNRDDAKQSGRKWFPYDKGGAYRKWYGNREYIVNWKNDGYEMQTKLDPKGKRIWAHNFNLDYIFKKHISCSAITSGDLAFRYYENGFLFDSASASAFTDDSYILEILAFLNSNLAKILCNAVNPTINFKPGNYNSLPFIKATGEMLNSINELVFQNVNEEKMDYDSEESSWDFEKNPLVKYNEKSIEVAYSLWQKECESRFLKVKQNEIELNRYINIVYGVFDSVQTDVEDKRITIHLATKYDITKFVSYAVGCMFGRYSLDENGIVYAGGVWNLNNYKTFIPDNDAIIPICDDEYFTDDIVGRFIEFVEIVYGKETLNDNLQFIADALGGKGSSREVIRNYFINDFYSDHLKAYQKRPIYWLFDSGKKNGFKCLVYMHRYQPDTIARIRTDYIHELQARYRTAIEETVNRTENALGSDKIKLIKKLNKLKAQDEELHIYEEKIHHLADQMISINLDDGVKKNYEIFKDVLAKIK